MKYSQPFNVGAVVKERKVLRRQSSSSGKIQD